MAIEIQDGFSVSTALPIDARQQVASQAARDAIPTLVRWEGMEVYSVGDAKSYKLVGGITNDFWIEDSGSGAGVIVVADTAELEAIPEEDRTQGMLVYVLDSGATYQLRGGITNNDWADFGQPVYIIVQDEGARLDIRNNVRTFGLLVFQQDIKKMFRLGAGLTNSDWEELYVDRTLTNLEAAFQLTCDEDLFTWETVASQGGTFVKETVNPLNGTASYKFTRSTSASTAIIVSPPQAVARKFRGQMCTLYFPYTYDGLNDIASVVLFDNTNNATIESLKLPGTNGAVNIAKMNVTIPLTCDSVDVIFRFDGADNSKVLQFDDIQLTSDTTIYADIDNMSDWQSYTPTFTGFGTVTSPEVQWRRNGDTVELRGKFTTGTSTAVEARMSLPNGYVSAPIAKIPSVQGAGILFKNTNNSSSFYTLIEPSVGYITFGVQNTTLGGSLVKQIGSNVSSGENVSIIASVPILGWSASSPNIVLANETFSTDTAALKYANASEYNLTTLANAPVGTYITFTYAANTNTRTQTTGANRPTQTDADMNANGIQIFTRAYNQDGFPTTPTAYAIQIGKGMKGVQLGLYKSVGKVTAGSLDFYSSDSVTATGIAIKDYNEVTGVLVVDVGFTPLSTATSRLLLFSDVSSQTNGYLVINASKSPALSGVPVRRSVYLKDVKPSGTDGGTFTSGAWQTRTLNTLEGDTSFVTLSANQFTLPAGTYEIEASAPAYQVGSHKSKLRNVTDSTDAIIGSAAASVNNASASITTSNIVGRISLTSSKSFEIQHRCASTFATSGFGVASIFGDSEVYSIIKITKVI